MISYLSQVRKFTEYLAHKDSTLTEILDFLVRVIFPPLSVDSAIFFQGNDTGEFTSIANSGLSLAGKKILHNKYNLSENFPASKAIQTGEIVWISISDKSRDDFPLLLDYKEIVASKTIIAFPVWVDRTPTAAMVILSSKNLEESPEIEAFLIAISSIFALYHYRKIVVSPDEPNIELSHPNKTFTATDRELTQRQHVILRLISEERTNQSISEFLGYSESTIRQEIMRIFDKLGCSHRSEAATIYKSYSHTS